MRATTGLRSVDSNTVFTSARLDWIQKTSRQSMQEQWIMLDPFQIRSTGYAVRRGLYALSNFGRIWNLDTGEEVHQYHNHGYLTVHLLAQPNHSSFSISVHRLVAVHFLGQPALEDVVNHLDGNSLNNDVRNLEYCTKAENLYHGWALKFLDYPKQLRMTFFSQQDYLLNRKYHPVECRYCGDTPRVERRLYGFRQKCNCGWNGQRVLFYWSKPRERANKGVHRDNVQLFYGPNLSDYYVNEHEALRVVREVADTDGDRAILTEGWWLERLRTADTVPAETLLEKARVLPF